MDNYLSAEQLIVTRLKERVPELVGAFSAADLDSVQEAKQTHPAAHVLYYGDRIVEGSGRSSIGDCQTVDQVWYVILVVKNARTQLTNEAARADAGPLILKILKALQGWQPSPEHSPMKRVNGAAPGFKSGFAYLPFCFTTRITVTAS